MSKKEDKEDSLADFTREYLRRIDKKLDTINHDIRDMKFRLGQVENTLAQHTAQLAYHTSQFDRVSADLDTIKNRLDLVSA
jgi:predicted  nucleic acid-binding Zn-ribbon protein